MSHIEKPKIKLRDFLAIVNDNFIEKYISNLYVEEWDEDFQSWFPQITIQRISHIKELEPYMDYEITRFYQSVLFGEIYGQEISVREIKG